MESDNASGFAVFLLLLVVVGAAALGYRLGVVVVEDHCAHVMELYGGWTTEHARIVCEGHR